MQEEETNQYLVELDKLMPSQVARTKWAPNMDLLAIVTYDHTLQLFRISYKAQRVFQIQQQKPITCLCFSIDSQFIAYGLMDGTVKIIRSQNGQKVVVVDGGDHSEIQNLVFINYCKMDPKNFLPFQKQSIQSKLILTVSPHKNCNKNAIIKINYFNQLKDQFVFLLSSQKKRTSIFLNGFIKIVQIDYLNTNLNDFRVLLSYYHHQIISILAQQKMDSYVLHLVQHQARQLIQYQQDIVKFNCLTGYISEIFKFVQGTYVAMQAQIRDILRQYHSKINLIDDPNHQNINPCHQLFKFLNLGSTSPALVNFFSKELYDSKIPQKLDETLTSLFTNLHDLILQSTQNSLQRAVILLNQLKNMSHSQRFQIFGLIPKDIILISDQITKLYTMTQILLVESTQAKFDIRNLLVWLNKSTIKTSQQNDVEIQNTKSYLNKYTVDFNRLHKFLSDQNKFKLDHLGAFFNKNDQTRKMNIQSPQFRLLCRNQSKNQNPQLYTNYKKLQKLLELEDIIIEQKPQNRNQSFKSFKDQMQECSSLWQKLINKPISNLSKKISKKYQTTEIGKIKSNQLLNFQIKSIKNQNNQLIVYYVEKELHKHKIIKYNCCTKNKRYIWTNKYNILSISVAGSLIAVLLDRHTHIKIVAEITNEDYNGEQIIIGKRISKIEGQLDIDTSLRGLNSVIVDKNKMIIFD